MATRSTRMCSQRMVPIRASKLARLRLRPPRKQPQVRLRLASHSVSLPGLRPGETRDFFVGRPRVAYTSDESTIPQIYVQPFPATGGRFQVSKSGSTQPLWRGDGKELFFLDPDRNMMVAPVDTTRQFEAGVPRPLFKTVANQTTRQYAVTNDGQRFLLIVPRSDRDASPLPLTVVLNWLGTVQK
jgi:hypothetical protein